ncbi:MAG: hypothetical protein E5V72_16920 [Mesorhizobium sp.]|nr:MAG: hypothetical protein EOS59_25075 [Mesorhizobium sp.]RWE63100.1 MAG: hypothetical protein EOS24_05710 [Mesorhizobium sp.]RWE90771.1 MAG: hypothetical protein EOS68_29950 [Mesorhizobium sp.]RWF09730.1 MAG: hypothetical protein EOS69_17445 [Mesorhizobium sp.]RWF21222.1 MAG: hypothetical protein EOS25_05560 [Mesorhizobium sp.]
MRAAFLCPAGGRVSRRVRKAPFGTEPCKSPRGQGAVLAMFRSREINDHTKQALLTEITLTEALLNGRQARK